MEQYNIPVSLSFFKRYTYYEECIDYLLKVKANGNQQMYEALYNSEETRESALQAYYKAFYLKPEIRRKYHIRLKAAPKKIKEKLLLIPKQDTGAGAAVSNPNLTKVEKITPKRYELQDAVKDFENSNTLGKAMKNFPEKDEHKKQVMLAAKNICEEDCVVQDDDEPLSSPDITSALPENNAMSSPAAAVNDKEGITHKEIPCTSAVERDIKEKNSETAPGHKSNICPTPTFTNKNPNFHYNDLVPYVHCCPLTYKEFVKYSNISEVVEELCAKGEIRDIHKRVVLQRSYILFYLVPETRKETPINKIQFVDPCPSHIKEKFFTIPTNLYLKKDNPKKLENVVAANETNINVKSNKVNLEIVAGATISTINEQSARADVSVNQQEAITAAITQINEGNSDVEKNIVTDDAANLKTNCTDNNQPQHRYESANSFINQQLLEMQSTSANGVPICLPVSLDEFKTYTHYEDIVQKLFKIKAQHNKDLYFKYMCSQIAFDKTLKNYYYAFYVLPSIREICPIQLKPLSDLIKSVLLRVPEGVKLKDLSNFKLEQLVEPEFVVSASNEKPSLTAEISPVLNSVENKSLEIPAQSIKSKSSQIKYSSTSENISTSSALSGTKRTSNESMESSSAKRHKIEQTQEASSEGKKTYKELLPYAHCCPISITEFKKYTNITELFTSYCQKHSINKKKLPFMIQRAYILHYLAPENRKSKLFNKLQISDECPASLRSKIFEIPRGIYLKDGRNDLKNEEIIKSEIQTQIKTDEEGEKLTKACCVTISGQKARKEPIVILENRVLPSIEHPLPGQSKHQQIPCSNTTCVFHHISCFDFIKSTNVLSFLPERKPERTVIQNHFKKFIYKILKYNKCDNKCKYMINCDFACKLLKHNNICEKCENDLKPVVENDAVMSSMDMTASSSSISDNERVSSVTDQTVVERCVVNDGSGTQSSTTEAPCIDVEGAQEDPVISSQTQRTDEHPQQELDLLKYLRRDKTFSKFCQKLLAKLNLSVDQSVSFTSESYSIFLQCNEIPLKQIVNDFCENNEDIAERIWNNLELIEALQRYYYIKYLTNESFASKYPPKLKQIDLKANNNSVEENSSEKSNEKCKGTKATSAEGNETADVRQEKEEGSSIIMDQDKSPTGINAVEEAKRIFFRNVDKTHTLAYTLRTSFGYKQLILRTVLSLSFNEFLDLTNIYKGEELYEDNHIANCMYRYVFRTPLVWPTNLYLTLENLCKFLLKKKVFFEDYSIMLSYISPKLLHWSDLLSCTNILDCIKNDFEKRTGKILDTFDIKSLNNECIGYYNRCWKAEKWLGGLPLVYEEFSNNIFNASSQVESMAPEDYNVPSESNNNLVAISEKLDGVETTREQMVSCLSPYPKTIEPNCSSLPHAEQQVAALQGRESVSYSPLDNNKHTNLNIPSTSTCKNYDEIYLYERTKPIKTEPSNSKFLSNILFYEDENSEMQCLNISEEVIDLDNTIFEQDAGNLPPSQIDFEEIVQNHEAISMLVEDVGDKSLPTQTGNIGNRVSPNAIKPYVLINDRNNSVLIKTQETSTSNEFGPLPLNCAYLSSTQLNQLLVGTLRSSAENVAEIKLKNLNVTDTAQEDNYMCVENEKPQEAMEISSSNSNATQTSAEDSCAEPTNKTLQDRKLILEAIEELFNNNVAAPVHEQQQQEKQQKIIVKQADPCTSNTAKCVVAGKSTNQTCILQASVSPIPKASIKTYANKKVSKNIATIRPLKNSDLVPQIRHNTRPLQTVPAHPVVSNNDNQVRQPTSDILSSSSVTLNLTPDSDSPNSSFQLQLLSNLGTHIYISQEFNRNCSVFDNTSLLRLVDGKTHHTTRLCSSGMPQNESEETYKHLPRTLEEQQQQSQHEHFVLSDTNQKADERAIESSTQASNNVIKTTAASDHQQQPRGPIVVTHSNSSTIFDTNDEICFFRDK